ncbi:MAG: hypothetical protein LC648_01135 [Novosphingobium sp.]|nr:hypothetical protein [Novosphingobium sp.]
MLNDTRQEFDDLGLGTERSSLRDAIGAATAADNAALDHALVGLDLAERGDLIRFLGINLSARAGVEQWLGEHCPVGWAPPPQTGLIADDLIALGGLPKAFRAPRFDAGPAGDWIGPAFVVARSQLGNRLLLAQAGAALPWEARRFLAGTAMQGYWQRLRTLLGGSFAPGDAHAAIAGARATFAHFRGCIERFATARSAVG